MIEFNNDYGNHLQTHRSPKSYILCDHLRQIKRREIFHEFFLKIRPLFKLQWVAKLA
jgi:hypothetical protein